MNLSEDHDKRQKEIARQERKVRIRKFADFFSIKNGDTKAGEAFLGIFGFAALVAGIVYLSSRCDPQTENQTQQSPASRDSAQIETPQQTQQRQEMNSMIYEYGRFCGGRMSPSQRNRCDHLEREIKRQQR